MRALVAAICELWDKHKAIIMPAIPKLTPKIAIVFQ